MNSLHKCLALFYFLFFYLFFNWKGILICETEKTS